MKTIYYLSYSDRPQTEGLMFPNELSPNTYAPGFWVVALNRGASIPGVFDFDAVENNELKTFEMRRVNHFVFQVDTDKYGKFYFRIRHIHSRYHTYIGNSRLINSDCLLYQVVPMDIQKLNQMCIEKGFFFVGRVDEQLESRTE